MLSCCWNPAFAAVRYAKLKSNWTPGVNFTVWDEIEPKGRENETLMPEDEYELLVMNKGMWVKFEGRTVAVL